MFRRFILWLLGSWVVLTGGISLALRLLVGSFDWGMLSILAILAALLAVMVAGTQCGGPPSDRHGLKRW
ncbi:MAG: hypothetical protein K2W95_25470 [Candidatus Obscuribacterales bacterium]|nr:hypothetical protein [Candidatus Obscuribacterales bacterium]